MLVYGEVKVGDRVFPKGTHFSTEGGKVEIRFIRKTLIMMLNKKEIEEIMKEYEKFYFKKDILERILPL